MPNSQPDIYKYTSFQNLPPDSWQREAYKQGRRFYDGVDQQAIDKIAKKSRHHKPLGRISLIQGDLDSLKIDRGDENSYTHLSIPA